MNSEIFKIQKPVRSSVPDAPCMIYNSDRSKFGHVELTPEISRLLGSSLKIYVRGYVDDDGILQIESRVHKQRW